MSLAAQTLYSNGVDNRDLDTTTPEEDPLAPVALDIKYTTPADWCLPGNRCIENLQPAIPEHMEEIIPVKRKQVVFRHALAEM